MFQPPRREPPQLLRDVLAHPQSLSVSRKIASEGLRARQMAVSLCSIETPVGGRLGNRRSASENKRRAAARSERIVTLQSWKRRAAASFGESPPRSPDGRQSPSALSPSPGGTVLQLSAQGDSGLMTKEALGSLINKYVTALGEDAASGTSSPASPGSPTAGQIPGATFPQVTTSIPDRSSRAHQRAQKALERIKANRGGGGGVVEWDESRERRARVVDGMKLTENMSSFVQACGLVTTATEQQLRAQRAQDDEEEYQAKRRLQEAHQGFVRQAMVRETDRQIRHLLKHVVNIQHIGHHDGGIDSKLEEMFAQIPLSFMVDPSTKATTPAIEVPGASCGAPRVIRRKQQSLLAPPCGRPSPYDAPRALTLNQSQQSATDSTAGAPLLPHKHHRGGQEADHSGATADERRVASTPAGVVPANSQLHRSTATVKSSSQWTSPHAWRLAVMTRCLLGFVALHHPTGMEFRDRFRRQSKQSPPQNSPEVPVVWLSRFAAIFPSWFSCDCVAQPNVLMSCCSPPIMRATVEPELWLAVCLSFVTEQDCFASSSLPRARPARNVPCTLLHAPVDSHMIEAAKHMLAALPLSCPTNNTAAGATLREPTTTAPPLPVVSKSPPKQTPGETAVIHMLQLTTRLSDEMKVSSLPQKKSPLAAGSLQPGPLSRFLLSLVSGAMVHSTTSYCLARMWSQWIPALPLASALRSPSVACRGAALQTSPSTSSNLSSCSAETAESFLARMFSAFQRICITRACQCSVCRDRESSRAQAVSPCTPSLLSARSMSLPPASRCLPPLVVSASWDEGTSGPFLHGKRVVSATCSTAPSSHRTVVVPSGADDAAATPVVPSPAETSPTAPHLQSSPPSGSTVIAVMSATDLDAAFVAHFSAAAAAAPVVAVGTSAAACASSQHLASALARLQVDPLARQEANLNVSYVSSSTVSNDGEDDNHRADPSVGGTEEFSIAHCERQRNVLLSLCRAHLRSCFATCDCDQDGSWSWFEFAKAVLGALMSTWSRQLHGAAKSLSSGLQDDDCQSLADGVVAEFLAAQIFRVSSGGCLSRLETMDCRKRSEALRQVLNFLDSECDVYGFVSTR